MRNWRIFLYLTFCLGAATCALSGCGSSSTQLDDEVDSGSKRHSSTTTPDPLPPLGGDEDTTGDDGTGEGAPLLTYTLHGKGYNEVRITALVNQVLKVRFRPETQDRNIDGTGFYPRYAQMGVYLQVGDSEQPTPLLSNGLISPQQQSKIIDFSSAIVPNTRGGTWPCDRTDPNCRAEVTIRITHPNNDYFCFNFGTYCTHTHVYDTHPWHATLLVQTDDTQALK